MANLVGSIPQVPSKQAAPTSAWKVLKRLASIHTSHELTVLADRYQNGQPALAANIRAAAAATRSQGY